MKSVFDKNFSSMILSASGWRMVFAASGDEEDSAAELTEEKAALAVLAAQAFAQYIQSIKGKEAQIVVGTDTRPTGPAIADCMIRAFSAMNVKVRFVGISAAPEIMSYAKSADAFAYISASHNPIGHNGIKFGLSDGGVIPAEESAKLIASFKKLCGADNPEEDARALLRSCPEDVLKAVYAQNAQIKKEAVAAYESFTRQVVSAETDKAKQSAFFDNIKNTVKQSPLAVVCDMNGSARCLSIDSSFLCENGIGFYAINDQAGKIVHAIIPEPENLIYCAREMERLHKEGKNEVQLGYMPDCDGDRGNIVYWDQKEQKARVLAAQEVFALSVLSELAFRRFTKGEEKTAVAVNGPTSMRINDIAQAFGAAVFRSEVGEANAVNLARSLREKGYIVPILGEGSNGGNITHPAAVRDPLNTLFALIKLLTIRDANGKKGLFHLWCALSDRESAYRDDFTLADIIQTLPAYATTGVSEKRALLHIMQTDHARLKRNFQKLFCAQWREKETDLRERYGIMSWEAAATVGINEILNPSDFGVSGKGGLKIIFKNGAGENRAYMWMRGSGTEPVFRIMCDVKGGDKKLEAELIDWETAMLVQADAM